MAWSVGRWYASIGTKDWRNYISIGGVAGLVNIVFKHLQFVSRVYWKPSWPRLHEREFFDHSLDSSRWTSHTLIFSVWPVTIGLFWRETCHGCGGEYSKDYEDYQVARRLA